MYLLIRKKGKERKVGILNIGEYDDRILNIER